MKNPHLQLKEAIAEIEENAYEDDDEFVKRIEAELEKYRQFRATQVKMLKFTSPHHRAKKKFQIGVIDKQIQQAERKLREYKNNHLNKDGKVEKENPNQEKLDAAFAKAQEAHERIYILYKHTQPHLIEDFTKIAADGYTPEELEEFFANIARREAEELKEILASVNDDGTSLRP